MAEELNKLPDVANCSVTPSKRAATPKSATFATPVLVVRILAPLISRCRTPWACKYASPKSTYGQCPTQAQSPIHGLELRPSARAHLDQLMTETNLFDVGTTNRLRKVPEAVAHGGLRPERWSALCLQVITRRNVRVTGSANVSPNSAAPWKSSISLGGNRRWR